MKTIRESDNNYSHLILKITFITQTSRFLWKSTFLKTFSPFAGDDIEWGMVKYEDGMELKYGLHKGGSIAEKRRVFH